MEISEIRKYQLEQLKILNYVVEVCDKLDLNYYLFAGTLLGAVRHKGFIPWDADIDIIIWRNDYDKLCDYLRHNDGLFYLDDYYNNKYYLSSHAVVREKNTRVVLNAKSIQEKSKRNGVYIDLFPIDKIPDNDFLYSKQKKRLEIYAKILNAKACWIYPNTKVSKIILKKILCFLLLFVSFKSLHKKQEKLMTMYNKQETKFCTSLSMPINYWHIKYPVEVFKAPKRITFENNLYCVPTLYETFLKIHYGDFMKLPPEKERYRYLDGIKKVDFESSNE